MIHHGDSFDVLPGFDPDSIDACVTDPPYGIGFMGREWDTFKPGTGTTRKLMHPREREAAKVISDNPNINGRHRSPALSPSQIDYDYSPVGLRAFQEWTERWAAEVFRVLKPGAYIVVCGAPRSHHRMMCGLEDAGFVVRDCFAWLFSSGFPKSLNFGCKCRGNAGPYSHAGLSTPERDVRRVQLTDVPAAVDAGDESRQVLFEGLSQHGVSTHGQADSSRLDARGEQSGVEGRELHRAGEGLSHDPDAGAPPRAGERVRAGASRRGGKDPRPAAETGGGSASQGPGPREQQPGKSASLRLPSRTLDSGASDRGARCERCGLLTSARGVGTALKPAHEPITLAWKPFKGTIADTYIKHGTAALNIDACRIEATGESLGGGTVSSRSDAWDRPWKDDPDATSRARQRSAESVAKSEELGRWPANVLLDEIAAAALDEQTGELTSGANPTRRGADKFRDCCGDFKGQEACDAARGLDVGGASRFYYVAKPSREERDYGTHGLEARARDESRKAGNPGGDNPRNRGLQPRGNFHPTVKPVELMRWLVRLVTPAGGLVLDPFTGSGTTGMACRYEHRRFIGIEREADYVRIAEARIASVAPLFGDEATA